MKHIENIPGLQLKRGHQTQDCTWHKHPRDCWNGWSDGNIPAFVDAKPRNISDRRMLYGACWTYSLGACWTWTAENHACLAMLPEAPQSDLSNLNCTKSLFFEVCGPSHRTHQTAHESLETSMQGIHLDKTNRAGKHSTIFAATWLVTKRMVLRHILVLIDFCDCASASIMNTNQRVNFQMGLSWHRAWQHPSVPQLIRSIKSHFISYLK